MSAAAGRDDPCSHSFTRGLPVPNEKHPFDLVADQLTAAADAPVAAQKVSPDYWELQLAADDSVGDYPQAAWAEEGESGEEDGEIDDTEGLGPDGFPNLPDGLPELALRPGAKWTDVLSSCLWSEGYLLSPAAHATFGRFDLGNSREYPAVVRGHDGERRPYTYIYCDNQVEPDAIDFRSSEFYITNMLGVPGPAVSVDSFEERSAKLELALAGKLDGCGRFSRIEHKTLFFKPGRRPTVDLFSLSRLGIRVYITAALRGAILEPGITGLEIKENRRLHVR